MAHGKRQTSFIPWIIILLIVGGGVGAWYYYQKHPKDSATEYRTAKVAKGDIIQSVTASGQLNPVVNVQVGSQISGIIEKLYADFNSRVTNGQIIAQLDPATYKSRVTQAEAEVANARASLELTQLNAKRSAELSAAGLIARQENDKAIVDLHQAEATVKIREASLESAKVDLARTTIYAPVDGIVISRNIDVGQTVAASFSAPILFLIANDLAKMQIDALVSEADVGGVEVGENVTFTVEAFPASTFKGQVFQVRNAPMTNQNVVSYDTVIEVKNPDLKLKPGMTASVSIITSNRESVLTVPNAALRFKPPENAVIKSNGTNAPAKKEREGMFEIINGETNYIISKMPEGFQTMAKPFDKNNDGKLNPAEGAAMRSEMMARFAQGGGQGGPGGGFGRKSGSSTPSKPRTQTLYVLESTNRVNGVLPTLNAVEVRLGISDGVNTEVISGLKEGDIVVTGSNAPPPEKPTTASNPMAPSSPFGGRRGR